MAEKYSTIKVFINDQIALFESLKLSAKTNLF